MTKEENRQTISGKESPLDLDELLRHAETSQPDEPVGETDAAGHAETEPETEQKKLTWKTILGGDILTHRFFRRQVKLLALLVVYAVIYIGNRYNVQRQMIEIDRLEKELTDIKYDALTRTSELTEKSRQSRIEDYISQEESELRTSTNPPYLIK